MARGERSLAIGQSNKDNMAVNAKWVDMGEVIKGTFGAHLGELGLPLKEPSWKLLTIIIEIEM